MKRDFGSLIRGINFNVNSFIASKLEPYGINKGQVDYFLLIAQNPGITQLEIANHLNVGKASVTKALKILEAKEVVDRQVDTNDRRHIKCYITKKGNEKLEYLLGVKERVESDLFEDFAEEELTRFYDYLSRLHKNSITIKASIDKK